MLSRGPSIDSAHDLSQLLKALKEEGEKRRKNAAAVRQIIVGIVSIYVVTTVILFIIKGKVEFSSIASMFTLFALAASGVAVNQNHSRALKEASRWIDPRLVPHLLEVLDAADEEIKGEAKRGLKVLLPLVTEAHSADFNSHQLMTLGSLSKDQDEQLAAKAIALVGRIGVKENLADLDFLADAEAEAGKARPLQALALQARGDLRMRLAREIVQGKAEPGEDSVKSQNS